MPELVHASRPARSRSVLALVVPLALGAGLLSAPAATAATPVRSQSTATSGSASWFTDPLTPAQRAALVAVPAHPASVHGGLQRTQALDRTADGDLAVPVGQARGHQLATGQAVVLNRRDVVSVHQSAATLHEVAALAGSLRDVTSVRCEGYSTVGGPERRQDRLSAERAAGICALLAQHRTGLSTTSVGYGSRRPVLVGGTSAQRAHNRRVVVVALASRTPKPPAPPAQQAHVPGAPTLSSVTGGVLSATLTFAAPASTGGSTVTGYAWSTDQTTWTPLTTTGSSPYTVQLTSLTPGTATYYVRAVNAVGAGAASAGVPATVTAPVVPTAPSVMYGIDACSQILAWFYPGAANGSTVTGYEYSLDDGQTWTTAQNVTDVGGGQLRFENPVSETCQYLPSGTILMRATSADGPGAVSDPALFYYGI